MTTHDHHDGIDLDTSRLEAFSDGVLAIIITIMVLEIRPPHEPTLAALRPLLPIFAAYVLSFTLIGVYWNNHHHLFKATDHINGSIMWANLHLLFWVSLTPFATAWVGEEHDHSWPAALYGGICFMSAVAYSILVRKIIAANPRHRVHVAIGRDFKGKVSLVFYALAVPLSLVNPWFGYAIYAIVAAMWFIPDRRLERLAQ